MACPSGCSFTYVNLSASAVSTFTGCWRIIFLWMHTEVRRRLPLARYSQNNSSNVVNFFAVTVVILVAQHIILLYSIIIMTCSYSCIAIYCYAAPTVHSCLRSKIFFMLETVIYNHCFSRIWFAFHYISNKTDTLDFLMYDSTTNTVVFCLCRLKT